MSNDDESLNALQGYEDSEDVLSKISSMNTDFGTEYNKLHDVLTEHSSALKPLLGFPVQRPDFDMHIDFNGPIPNSRCLPYVFFRARGVESSS